MRTMYDSITAANIPPSARMVAGYVDGKYKWSDADWARFPNAVKVRIAVFPQTNDGVVLDVETGDARPDQAPAWVTGRRLAGLDPSVYCSAAIWPSVKGAFTTSNVREPHYWIASYPGGGALVPDGAVAHQYIDVGPYDLSAVNDYWPGVDKRSSDKMGTWFKYTETGGALHTGLLIECGKFYGLPAPSDVTPVDLNVNGQAAADAYWTDLTTHWQRSETRGPVNGG